MSGRKVYELEEEEEKEEKNEGEEKKEEKEKNEEEETENLICYINFIFSGKRLEIITGSQSFINF